MQYISSNIAYNSIEKNQELTSKELKKWFKIVDKSLQL